ncbi:hypothetical protein DFR24_0259 [Panacagrimonas perspica]|uniref:AB hydrolase-1 domain-containing protein n=2 Tax=Panacagrimonas perspica TaxID=381431 RepID=A0A4R7PB70_9GAMM|nr:hypothetical protein DFR24_0259 [Panacagrimonas perspica]
MPDTKPGLRMSTTSGRILASAFRPHPLLRGAHAQTIAPALLRPTPALRLRVERLETPDGDFVDLGWTGEEHAQAPIAVLVHGLGGNFESKYLRGSALRLVTAGWRVCVLLLRGASEEPNRLPRAYNQGDTADLRHLWRVLREREPGAFIATIGWSLGGNVTLKALGEEGAGAPTDVACAVSVPFSLHECAEHLRIGFARHYQKRLLDSLKDMVRRKHARQPVTAPADLGKALAARDFFEFDDAFTAPLNGYRDAEDYYARAACGQYLPRIQRPTLVLHALDDPFMVPSVVPDASRLSSSVTLELSPRGGHVGFISAGRFGEPVCWAEAHLCAHLVAAYARHRQSGAINAS